jgi:hypothetical protein
VFYDYVLVNASNTSATFSVTRRNVMNFLPYEQAEWITLSATDDDDQFPSFRADYQFPLEEYAPLTTWRKD